MTLIAVYNSEGLVGRCDARCYEASLEASLPDCDCICGGRNHGRGQKIAIENTREMAETWIQRYNQEHKLKNPKWELGQEISQLSFL